MAVEEASLRDGDPEKRPRVSDAVDICLLEGDGRLIRGSLASLPL